MFSEIARCGDDSFPEEMVPHAVCENAREEGMVSGGEVIRVGGAATCGRGILGVLGRRPEGWRAERREISGFDFPSALVGIASS